MTQTTETQKKTYEILKGFSTAMFVTVGSAGRPGARPMHVAKLDENTGDICFLTGQGGALVKEIKADSIVLLAFQSDSAYVSLRGTAKVVQDRARIKEMWKEPYKVWFPAGPDDPEIALVTVAPMDAEYWDQRGANKLEYFFEAARAYIKGEKPDLSDADQHAKTQL